MYLSSNLVAGFKAPSWPVSTLAGFPEIHKSMLSLLGTLIVLSGLMLSQCPRTPELSATWTIYLLFTSKSIHSCSSPRW
jgi:hypothetical protein